MENITQAIQISFLAMIVIFLVLGLLIGVIKFLVYFFPYQEPPAAPLKTSAPAAAASRSLQDENHIAAIHAALAHHLGKVPQDIHIIRITSL